MRDKLLTSIKHVEKYATAVGLIGRTQVRRVLAAARAYACRECRGTGVDETMVDPCQFCKADREVADS